MKVKVGSSAKRYIRFVALNVISAIFTTVVFSINSLALGQGSSSSWIEALIEERAVEISEGHLTELGEVSWTIELSTLRPVVTISAMAFTDFAGLKSIRMTDIRLDLELLPSLFGSTSVKSLTVGSAKVEAEINPQIAAVPLLDTASESLSLLEYPLSAINIDALTVIESIDLNQFEATILMGEERVPVSLTEGTAKFVRDIDSLTGTIEVFWELDDGKQAAIDLSFEGQSNSSEYTVGLVMTGASIDDLATVAPLPERLKERNLPFDVDLSFLFDLQEGTRQIVWKIVPPTPATESSIEETRVELESINATGLFDFATRRLTINGMEFAESELAFQASGHIDFGIELDTPQLVEGIMQFDSAQIGDWTWPPTSVGLKAANLAFRLNLENLNLESAHLSLRAGEFEFQTQGQAKLSYGSWNGFADFDFVNLPHDMLIELWPGSGNAKQWAEARLNGGSAFEGNGGISFSSETAPEFALGFEFKDVEMEAIKGFPPLLDASGFGFIDSQSYSVRLDSGFVKDPNGRRVDFTGTEVNLNGIFTDDPWASVALAFKGKVKPLLALLNQPPLNLLQGFEEAMELASGNVSAEGTVEFQLISNLTFEDIKFTIDGQAYSVRSQEFQGTAFESNQVQFTVDNFGLDITATGNFGSIPASGSWSRDFTGQEILNPITGTLEISPTMLDDVGVSLPSGMLSVNKLAAFTLSFPSVSVPEFKISTNIESLNLAFLGSSTSQNVGKRARLQIEGRLGEQLEISRISLSGPEFQLEGEVFVADNGRISAIRFHEFNIGEWLIGRAFYQPEGDHAALITSGTLDLTNLSMMEAGNQSVGRLDKPIRVQLNKILLRPGLTLNSVNGTVHVDNEVRGLLRGAINGKTNITASFAFGDSGLTIRLRSNDGGEILRSAGILGNLYGGDIAILIQTSEDSQELNVRMRLENVTARRIPVLVELLSLASILTVLTQLDGDGIPFAEIEADFTVGDKEIVVRRAFAVGASLGLTLKGTIDAKNNKMDLQGALTPFNILNEFLLVTPLRTLGLEKGDGFGAVSFTIKGPIENPATLVNPLSVLAPGMFKSFFQ